jgi:hypothetical protein
VRQVTKAWLTSLEKKAERVVRDSQDLITAVEGRYVQNTVEVERAISLWQDVKALRKSLFGGR